MAEYEFKIIDYLSDHTDLDIEIGSSIGGLSLISVLYSAGYLSGTTVSPTLLSEVTDTGENFEYFGSKSDVLRILKANPSEEELLDYFADASSDEIVEFVAFIAENPELFELIGEDSLVALIDLGAA